MIVGTAGHIDHGKTALVRALTGVDADRLKEEKARGITIELGFAYTDLGTGGITGFVDVPGHERLIHTMLAGAGGIDFALLVVAADDGVMPQTREHLAILDLLGIERGAVALTKCDLVDADRRGTVAAEVAETLAGTSLANAPILPVSTLTGEGLEALSACLGAAAGTIASRSDEGPLRLPVDRAFTVQGAGTVVTGTVLAGRVSIGDEVLISPAGLSARVRSIHAQNRPVERGRAGERCALGLAGERIGRDAISRGDMVIGASLHSPTDRIDAELRLLDGEPRPVAESVPVHLHTGAEEIVARMVPLGGPIAPGSSGPVQLVLDRPIAAAVFDRFVVRDVSATRTMGGGCFLDLRAPQRRRRSLERLAHLTVAANREARAALEGLLATPPYFVAEPDFVRDRALPETEAIRAAEGAERIGTMLLAPSTLATLRQSLAERLASFHEANPELQGLGRERLRLALEPRLPGAIFPAFLRQEAEAGRLVLEGAFVRLPEHVVRLSEADEALWNAIRPKLDGVARFRPPRVRDFAAESGEAEGDVRRVLKLCARAGRVDEIAHDHFFLRSTTAEMVRLASETAAEADGGWFVAASFRDRMQNGRKVAIQILDFFDRHGVTLRKGDLRRINPRRLDLFDPA